MQSPFTKVLGSDVAVVDEICFCHVRQYHIYVANRDCFLVVIESKNLCIYDLSIVLQVGQILILY